MGEEAWNILSSEPTPFSPPGREPHYGGFWIRLGAFILDCIILFPFIALYIFWGHRLPRLAFQFEPMLLLAVTSSYHVLGVRYWGGTPGKLLCGLRVVRTDLEPAGWKEAVLRESVNIALGLVGEVLFILAAQQVSDAAFAGGRKGLMIEIVAMRGLPGRVVDWLGNGWMLSEFLVLLTNRKRRALHDFVAGAVVVQKPQDPEPASQDSGQEKPQIGEAV